MSNSAAGDTACRLVGRAESTHSTFVSSLEAPLLQSVCLDAEWGFLQELRGRRLVVMHDYWRPSTVFEAYPLYSLRIALDVVKQTCIFATALVSTGYQERLHWSVFLFLVRLTIQEPGEWCHDVKYEILSWRLKFADWARPRNSGVLFDFSLCVKWRWRRTRAYE